MNGFRTQAPMARVRGLAAGTRRPKNPSRTGLNRTSVRVARNSAFRSRGFPAFDSRAFFRTLVPPVNSRGDSPRYAAADPADGIRWAAGNSARTAGAEPGDRQAGLRAEIR